MACTHAHELRCMKGARGTARSTFRWHRPCCLDEHSFDRDTYELGRRYDDAKRSHLSSDRLARRNLPNVSSAVLTAFKRVLVPTDFGEASSRAVDLAITLAEKFESHVTLVHSTALPTSALSAYAEGLYWPTEEMSRAAQKELDAAVSKARRRYPSAEGVLVNLEPWQAILDLAEKDRADLIVMGTHGRKGISRVFLGSVAERVVRFSRIPVMTVSGRAEQEARAIAIAPTNDAGM
jgi:nucleotide-binding universal stress UspA family protein